VDPVAPDQLAGEDRVGGQLVIFDSEHRGIDGGA
jgi:hypothetical protein